MKRLILLTSALAVVLSSSVAWAGGPESSSPEPSFWLFLVLGALPFAAIAWKQLRTSPEPAPVTTTPPQR